MKYLILHKPTSKLYGILYSKQDAENAILHLEDTKGYDANDLEIIEKEDM